MNAIDLRPHILDCGYNESQLVHDVEIDLGRRVPLVAFAHSPHDSRSSCLAVIETVGDPEAAVATVRVVGAPLVFALFDEKWQLWKQAAEKPRLIESIAPSELTSFFAQHQGSLNPTAVYRAKTWARFDKSYQLSFVDRGLLPLIEEESGQKLSSLIERAVTDTKSRLGWTHISDNQGHWLLKSNFWLLAGKILQDKKVEAFAGLNLEDCDQVFDRVAQHYGATERVPIANPLQAEALRGSAREISHFSSLELVTIEALAYLYENALITKATRTELGTHSTPAYLVDYVVGKLRPWIEQIPIEARHTFEPACGHAAFLTSTLRLLNELLPNELSSRDRHEYLRQRLHGCDIDTFALEIARLSLTLSDVPNPNGWDLQPLDMFESDLLSRWTQSATIVLSNPPFGVATSVLELIAKNLQPGSIFGVILPQTVLQSEKATSLRKLIAQNFEIGEICLFPDKVFTFSDAESAVIMARRLPVGRSRVSTVAYRHVRGAEIDEFKRTFKVANERSVGQSRFSESNHWTFWIPDLEEVWKFCDQLPKFRSIALIGQGFQFRSLTDPKFPSGSITESHEWSPGLVAGFMKLREDIETHEQPDEVWVNLDPSVISRPRHGVMLGLPQVVLNYARVSRGPWRLKAFFDPDGHAVSSRFLVVRPKDQFLPLEVLWAICNSPLANAYSYSFSGKRDVLVGLMRNMPVPNLAGLDINKVKDAVNAYLAAVGDQTTERQDSPAKLERLRELHWRVDSEVLRLYSLPVRLERQLLDLFKGAERRGVPFHQTSYFPEYFTDHVSLRQLLCITAYWDEINERRALLIRNQINSLVSNEEKEELQRLQRLADLRVRLLAPLPTSQIKAVQEDLQRMGIWEETDALIT